MFDFESFAQNHHIETRQHGEDHHVGSDWIGFLCPRCGGDSFHAGWNTKFGYFNCWLCGKIDTFQMIGELIHTRDSQKIKSYFAKHQIKKQYIVKQVVQRNDDIEFPVGTDSMLKAHRKYLKHRKFDPDQLQKQWGLLGTGPLSGKWSWRIMIPINDVNGRMVAYQGRSIGEAIPRYKTINDKDALIPFQSILYGLDRVKNNTILLVEGVTGSWRIGAPAVATFGIEWTTSRMNLIRRFERRFILFDPYPKAAIKRAEQLASALSMFPGETEIISGYDCQPGEMTEKQVKEIRKELKL